MKFSARFAVLPFAFLLAGCANPKYVKLEDPASGGEQKAGTESCAAYFPKGGCVTWSWEVRGSFTTMGTMIVKVGRENKADGTFLAVDPAGDIEVVLQMPDMGHGSAKTRVEHVDVGTFRVSNVSLYMAGHWQFHVKLKNGNEVQDTAIIDYHL